jgi:hypothetical protein
VITHVVEDKHGALRLGACSCLLSRNTTQRGTSEEKLKRHDRDLDVVIDCQTDGYVVMEGVNDLIDSALSTQKKQRYKGMWTTDTR